MPCAALFSGVLLYVAMGCAVGGKGKNNKAQGKGDKKQGTCVAEAADGSGKGRVFEITHTHNTACQ